MKESQVFEALGLMPGGDSGNTPEIAAPDERVAEQAGEDTKAQVPADPAPEIARSNGESEETPGRDPETPSDGEKRARADAAARRRRQETQAAIDRALEAEREKHRSELDAFFQAAGLKNTITGAPITNMDEFHAWKRAFDTAKLQNDLRDGKLTPEGLEQAISSSPSMRRMKQLLERDEQARRESGMAAAQAKIDAELREIHALDPSIRTAEDLLNMPAAKEFYEYVRRGNTFLDAFYLANRERLTQAAAEAAKQQAMNAARSKDHLHPAGASRGAGASSVPSEELELFRLLNPNATEAEIQSYYNKTKSR